MRERVENDLFGIADRLRAIDEGYFVLRTDDGFEVHNSLQRGSTFALKVPYPELDERTVRLVRKTRRERFAALLAETERQNAAAAKRAVAACADAATAGFERAMEGKQ